jgi:hypothetical protein
MAAERKCGDIVVAGTLLSLLACCTQQPPAPVTAPTSATSEPSSAELIVSGTALPAGYHIDTNRSLILGGGDTWTGRLSYTATGSADEVFDFLRREMPNFGWVELNAVRSDVNLLTFASEATGRIATIQVDRGNVLGGTRVEMVVSPGRLPATRPTAPPPRSRTPTAKPPTS